MQNRKKIFIVEDESLFALELESRLTSLGYTVCGIAANGKEAIKKTMKLQPDMVLMDIQLKGDMDGIETARKLKENYSLPVIFLTAYSDKATLQRAKQTQPLGYLVKPIQEMDLMSTLEMAIYKNNADKKVNESNIWLNTTLNSIGEGLIATDTKGNIKFMNPKAEALTGWNEEEAEGKEVNKVFQIISAKTRKRIKNPVEKVLKYKKMQQFTNHTLLVSKSGNETPISDCAAPIINNGKIEGAVLVFQDDTKRTQYENYLENYKQFLEDEIKQRTADLRESENKFRTLAENSEDFIFRINDKYNLLYSNPNFNRRYGRIDDGNLDAIEDDIIEKWKSKLQEAFEFCRSERLLVELDKGPSVDWRFIPEYDENGIVRTILAAGRDVSHLKKAENEIRIALQKSEELNDIKSKFVSMVSHEFRTPLATMLSSIEILKHFQGNLSKSDALSHFDKIINSIDYMTGLLDDLITINRADAGKLIANAEEVNIIELISEVISDSKASFSHTPSIFFECSILKLNVNTDPKLFRQILSNLLGNAIKYTPIEKNIYVVVTVDDSNVIIKIKDEGYGIPKSSHSELFTPFHRADNITNIPGTGLGLSITKRSVEMMGGSISFSSIEGSGTTFIVTLPGVEGVK